MDYTIIAQAFIAACVTIVLAYMQHLAAAKVEEVRVDLQRETEAATQKLDEIAKTGDMVHTLVNSSMSAQLKISAVALRRIAMLTKDLGDANAADAAEKLSQEHEAKQMKADIQSAGKTLKPVEVIPEPLSKSAISGLKRDIAAVPEKTAEKVVKRIKDNG